METERYGILLNPDEKRKKSLMYKNALSKTEMGQLLAASDYTWESFSDQIRPYVEITVFTL